MTPQTTLSIDPSELPEPLQPVAQLACTWLHDDFTVMFLRAEAASPEERQALLDAHDRHARDLAHWLWQARRSDTSEALYLFRQLLEMIAQLHPACH
ncbi:hypothetical protein LAJ19_20490 (plasmid) [Deinococcus taeanensis]|uniref:hypothetical protein n=1 Tax=Deinococcus taeanensis TaxID=2737050 RepID=UPI001CDBE447|nr:hypothetical protein [Deinococcus taeanensis]UBV45189.1 hypothetical protein LAJ19_20490 [Deinococcus taeanensis]